MKSSFARFSVPIVSFCRLWELRYLPAKVQNSVNGIVKIAATKVSAGVSTGIGDHESKYSGKETDCKQGDEQFEIDDSRSLEKMYQDMSGEGLQPVLNDYLYV